MRATYLSFTLLSQSSTGGKEWAFSLFVNEFYLTKYTRGTVSIPNDLYEETLDSLDTLLDTPVNAHI